MNIAVITLDSVRYDTMKAAKAPYMTGLAGKWFECFAQGTDTYLSHKALLKYGHFPTCYQTDAPLWLQPKSGSYVFRTKLPWDRNIKVLYPTESGRNIPKGFSRKGYMTVGIGGVNWFNTEFETSNIWKEYFDYYYWRPEFSEKEKYSLLEQLAAARTAIQTFRVKDRVANHDGGKLFFFMNIAWTHNPSYRVNSWKTQIKAVQEIDGVIDTVIELLPLPCHLFILGDHGSLFDVDGLGLTGHAFSHPKVLKVPLGHRILGEKK